jgi:hypothetical protein
VNHLGSAANPQLFPGSSQQISLGSCSGTRTIVLPRQPAALLQQKPQRESFLKKVVDSLKCISYSIEVKQMEK